jgi:hypothetical protein
MDPSLLNPIHTDLSVSNLEDETSERFYQIQRIPGGLVPEVEPLDTAEPIGSALAGACERLPEEIAPDVDSPDAILVFPAPRSIVNIIPQLLGVIPINENCEKLIAEIKDYEDSLWNKAPELHQSSDLWNPLGVILNRNVPSIEHDWQKKLVAIFSGIDF